ncbi:MAG: peptidylprolyl isomerase [Acidobacteriota bacterium]
MFHLFRNQGTAVKILLSAILGVVALSMVVYLIPSYSDPTANTNNPVLAEIGSKKLTASEAQAQFQRYSQGKVPAELMAVYFPQALNEMVRRYAAIQQAAKMGLTATDEEVLETLAKAFPQYFENGKLTQRQRFESDLAQQGFTVQAILDEMRDQIVMVKLQNVILESNIVTPQDVEDEYKRKYERASIDYIAFSPADLRSKVTVTEDEVKKYYETTKAQYQQPEKFAYRALVLSRDKVEAGIQPTEQELRAEYAAVIDNFRKPEQIHARHILLAIEGKTDAEKKTLKAKAEELSKQAKGGADFGELAKKNSEDSGTASNGGDLGNFSKGTMVPAFDAAAFNLKPKEVSGVVETQYGYHVIKLEEKTPATVTPFEAVRSDLENELKSRMVAEKMQTVTDQLHADLLKTPAAAADIAKKYNAEVITVPDGAPGQAVPTLGVSPEIDGALPRLQANGVSEVLSLPGDRAVVVVMDKRIPGRPSEFQEVQATLRDKLMGEAADKLMAERSKEAADRVKKGEDIHAVAKAMGVTVEGASNFGHTDAIPGLGPAAYMDAAFKGAGTVIGPVSVQGRTVVAKAVAKTEADMAGFEKERNALMLSVKTARAGQRNTLWMDSIVEKWTADGAIKIYQDQVQRVIGLMK